MLIEYIEIENFKRFGEKQRISLAHPAVLIGPNNCGKTSAIQAIALWSLAVKVWHEARANSSAKDRTAAAINRLAMTAVPIPKTRLLWHQSKVRTGNRDVPMTLTAGVRDDGNVRPLAMTFRNFGDDLIYCDPADDAKQEMTLIARAAAIKTDLLYPMSGLESEEPILKAGRIDVLLGQGRTAEVLRNLCLIVARDAPGDWKQVKEFIRRLFRIDLGDPAETPRGAVTLDYRQTGARTPFDLSQAGRGLQQMLLVLAYLYAHRGSIVLVDEPDAHLEILRQRQIYVLLRDVARGTGSQIVMATHSEVILDEALDTNLVLLLEGQADDLAQKTDIKNALKHYGAEHYVRAKQRGYVLYVEGGTDLDMLHALARKLDHPVATIWDERVNAFYVQDNYPLADTDTELERVEGGFGITPRAHFNALRNLLPGLKGLAVLDNDGRNRQDADEGDLSIRYWQRYEAENYFVTPTLLAAYAKEKLGLPLFDAVIDQVLDELVRERVFADRTLDFETWRNAAVDARRLIWDTATRQIKLSDFAEEFFRRLAAQTNTPMLLRKGELHELVEGVDRAAIDGEVAQKLDALEDLFKSASPEETP